MTSDVKIYTYKSRNVTFEDALEQTGYGRYNLYLILICGASLFCTNVEAYSVGFIVPSADCEFGLDVYYKGILTSSNFLGIIFTSLIWGYISDVKGRRNLLMISFFISFLTSVAAALTPSFWGFVILRFFNGICISGPSSIIFAYFGEFQNQKNCSRAISYISFFISAALLVIPGLGWLILPKPSMFNLMGLQISSWRLYMLILALPNLVASFGISRLPESPKFLYHSGRLPETLSILEDMYSVNTGQPKESYPVESLDDKVIWEEKSSSKSGLLAQIVPLFQAPYLLYMLAGCFMHASVFAISSGLFMWYPDIINQLSEGERTVSLTVCDALDLSRAQSLNLSTIATCNVDQEVFTQNLIVGAFYVAGYASWTVLVNALGNRSFFNTCMIISAIATIVICYITQKVLIDVLFLIIFILPGISVAVVSAMIVDLIPTNLCAMAVCISMTSGRLGSIISSSIAGMMLQWNCNVTFILYAISLIICLVLTIVFPKRKT